MTGLLPTKSRLTILPSFTTNFFERVCKYNDVGVRDIRLEEYMAEYASEYFTEGKGRTRQESLHDEAIARINYLIPLLCSEAIQQLGIRCDVPVLCKLKTLINQQHGK